MNSVSLNLANVSYIVALPMGATRTYRSFGWSKVYTDMICWRLVWYKEESIAANEPADVDQG